MSLIFVLFFATFLEAKECLLNDEANQDLSTKLERYLAVDFIQGLETCNIFDTPNSPEQNTAFKSYFRKTIAQLENRSRNNAEYKKLLVSAIERYFVFFPSDDLREKFQYSWLKVMTDAEIKLKKLHLWINEDLSFKLGEKHVLALRELRLSLAEKLDIYPIIIYEAKALAKNELNSDKEWMYKLKQANAHLALGEKQIALNILKKISKVNSLPAKSRWVREANKLYRRLENEKH